MVIILPLTSVYTVLYGLSLYGPIENVYDIFEEYTTPFHLCNPPGEY